MHDILNSPLFPLEELSPDTFVKLPKVPNAESKSVKLYIILAEPHLYLEGFTKDEVLSRPPSILRGCLFLRILHPVKIKEINLKLKGVSRTEWPEGIPPKKTEHFESKGILNHTWPFFSYLNSYPVTATSRNNADLYIPRSDSDVTNFSLDSNNNTLSPVTSATNLKPVLSPVSLLKSFRNTSSTLTSITSSSDLNASLSNSGNDDNKLFPPGDYVYSFELPIQSSLPESVCVTFGSISYSLEAHVERSGAFRSSLTARRPLSIVRAPFENSSEENEPIIIDRDWENRLQYDIVIYSKQVILNSYLPISFRMIPLEKIKVHRLRVYITEHLEYYCHNKKVHRTEPPKKILLLEHKPPKDCDNLLSLGNDEIGGVELDFQVFIPEYYNEKFHLHPDTTSEDVQSHHWIKISIRISKPEPTPEDPNKRKQYELSIDSPMHLLSSHCVHANTLLPSYEEQIKLDCITETNTNKTLTPISSSKQSLDKMMSPRDDTILESNLFKPDDSVPVEMLSPQAKPFSPIASPQLNAISPELRETPMIRPLDLSPMISPINRPRSTSKVSTVRSRNLSPVARHTASVRSIPSTDEPPPPPFIENPPSYAEATKSSKTKRESSSRRRETTNSTVSMDSSNSGHSGSSALSFSAGKHTGSSNSNSNSNSNGNSNAITPLPNNNNTGTTNSGSSVPTRISLNLGASMGSIAGLNNNGSNMQLHRLGSGLIPISQLNPSGTGTTASSTQSESTPSISAFLDSPLPNPDNNSTKLSQQQPPPLQPEPRSPSPASAATSSQPQTQGDPASSAVTTAGASPTRGRKKEPRDASSYDLAQDTDLRFKITPIRSASGSPYLRAQQHPSATSIIHNRTSSPMRSASPAPIVAPDRNLNRLIHSTFMPGFTWDDRSADKNTREVVSAPMMPPQISITRSNNDVLSDTPAVGTTAIAASPSSSSSPHRLHPQRQSAELSSVDRPLIREADEEGNFSDSSAEEYVNQGGGLSDTYNLHSNTMGSLNSLEMMMNSNRSQNTLNYVAGDRPVTLGRGATLNYLGNTMDGFDDGTDITSMGRFTDGEKHGGMSPSISMSSMSSHWGKLRNPKLAHPPPE